MSRLIKGLIFLLFAGVLAQGLSEIAEARAGRGRSMGKSSRPSYSQSYRQTPPPSYQNQPAAPQSRGGFGRALAGGIAGGFLGSMLFSSLGHAAPGAGGAAGGIGFIEIILIAGILFLAFRWWKSRQAKPAFASANAYGAQSSSMAYNASPYASQTSAPLPIEGSLKTEEASDLFFRLQGAFTRRDLSSVAEILTPDMYRELAFDLDGMKAQKRINRLENISVRRVELSEMWNEAGVEYARVRFVASLLDYVTDEVTGQVLEGSAHEPVKFEEDWTFARTSQFAPWQLAGISQV